MPLFDVYFYNYISILIVFILANYWEYVQVKYYKAKYSISDILLTTLGGILGFVLVNFF